MKKIIKKFNINIKISSILINFKEIKKEMLTLYYTFNLIQSLHLKNIETESLDKVIKSFAKSILSFIKSEWLVISVTEPSKEIY